jgi:hypothetical protein
MELHRAAVCGHLESLPPFSVFLTVLRIASVRRVPRILILSKIRR